jgi:membrane associated rhomboid family serine protease
MPESHSNRPRIRQVFHVAFAVLAVYVLVAVVVIGLFIGDLRLAIASVSMFAVIGLVTGVVYYRMYRDPKRDSQ